MLLLLVVVFRIGESPKTAAFKVSRVVYVYVLVGCVLCVSVCVCCIISCIVCVVNCCRYQSCVALLLSSHEIEMPSSAAR